MPTSSFPSVPGVTTTIQALRANYGPQARALGDAATVVYFSHLGLLQILSALVSIGFIAAAVYFSIQTGWLKNRVDRVQDVVLRADTSKKRVKDAWASVEAHFFAGDDNDLKIAIVEADTLLDETLHRAGVQGHTLGDRLKRVKSAQLPNIEEVWQAHKIRNQIAHEANFVLKRDLAEKALTVYEKALEHLGVLEPLADGGRNGASGTTGARNR